MRLRLRLGGLLIVLTIPSFNDQQRRLLIAVVLAVCVNAGMVGLMMVFLRNEVITKAILRSEKMVALNLEQDEDIRKAIELLENPKANLKKPDRATILSTEHSASEIKTVPDDLKNSRRVTVLGEDLSSGAAKPPASESEVEEGEFTGRENVVPFLKQPSVMERITGQSGSSGSTDLEPQYELNTYGWSFAPYMLKWKNKMTGKWYQITSRLNFNPYAHTGKLLVWVKMNRQGQLMDSKVLEYDCDKFFVAPAYASVVNSFPLDPLPDHFPEDVLETTWTITITN